MKKRIICILFVILLIASICYIRFYTVSTIWLSEWGIYTLLVPALMFLAATFEKKFNYKYLIATTMGVLTTVLLTTGDWVDRYIIQKAAATILGALVSGAICFLWTKKPDN